MPIMLYYPLKRLATIIIITYDPLFDYLLFWSVLFCFVFFFLIFPFPLFTRQSFFQHVVTLMQLRRNADVAIEWKEEEKKVEIVIAADVRTRPSTSIV